MLYRRYSKLWLLGWITTLNIDRSAWHNSWSTCDSLCCHVNTSWVAWRRKHWSKTITCAKIFLSKLWNITCSVMNSGHLYSHLELVPGHRLDCLKWCTSSEARRPRLYEGKKVSRSPFYADLVYREFLIFSHVYKEYYLLLCKWSSSYLTLFFPFSS